MAFLQQFVVFFETPGVIDIEQRLIVKLPKQCLGVFGFDEVSFILNIAHGLQGARVWNPDVERKALVESDVLIKNVDGFRCGYAQIVEYTLDLPFKAWFGSCPNHFRLRHGISPFRYQA